MFKVTDHIDARAAIEIRMALLTRMDHLEKLYPTVGSPERMKAIEELVHLTHELGFDCEGLYWEVTK